MGWGGLIWRDLEAKVFFFEYNLYNLRYLIEKRKKHLNNNTRSRLIKWSCSKSQLLLGILYASYHVYLQIELKLIFIYPIPSNEKRIRDELI